MLYKTISILLIGFFSFTINANLSVKPESSTLVVATVENSIEFNVESIYSNKNLYDLL